MRVPSGIGPGARRARANSDSRSVQVERERGHLDLAVAHDPLVARPVAVDLDAVALRVVEVQRLGHEVVGRSGQAPPRSQQPL